MDRIEEICDKIGQCDDNIIEQLVARNEMYSGYY